MIQNLWSKSRTTEVDDALVRIIGAYRKNSLNNDVYLSDLFAGLVRQSSRLTEAVQRMKAESVLEAKDEVRDAALRSVFYMVQGMMYHPAAEIKAAAEKINKVLDHYGMSVLTESYATESSLISSLLGDLGKQPMQAAMETLSGMTELVSALQMAQIDFEAARIAYEEEKGQESTQINATALKREVVDTINNQLVVYLRAMAQVNDAVYGPFARTVAETIAENNETVKRRANKKEPAA